MQEHHELQHKFLEFNTFLVLYYAKSFLFFYQFMLRNATYDSSATLISKLSVLLPLNLWADELRSFLHSKTPRSLFGPSSVRTCAWPPRWPMQSDSWRSGQAGIFRSGCDMWRFLQMCSYWCSDGSLKRGNFAVGPLLNRYRCWGDDVGGINSTPRVALSEPFVGGGSTFADGFQLKEGYLIRFSAACSTLAQLRWVVWASTNTGCFQSCGHCWQHQAHFQKKCCSLARLT